MGSVHYRIPQLVESPFFGSQTKTACGLVADGWRSRFQPPVRDGKVLVKSTYIELYATLNGSELRLTGLLHEITCPVCLHVEGLDA